MSLSLPGYFQKYWGVGADPAFIRNIPVDSQIGIQSGAASLNDGFVPDNFDPIAAGGIPPFGQDFNGILRQTTANIQFWQAGGGFVFDSAFATAIGGYSKGFIINSAVVPGKKWQSLVDNNTTDPDTIAGVGNWGAPVGTNPSGTPIASFSATVLPNCVLADGHTIGDASSGATTVGADLLHVFVAVWGQFSNAQCPIFDSSGSPTTRGANAFADFAAHKRLSTPVMGGIGVMGADVNGSGNLTGVPVSNGSITAPGSLVGENLHALTSGENGQHTHTIVDNGHIHTASVSDPTHSHSTTAFAAVGDGGSSTFIPNPSGSTSTGASATGIGVTIANHTTGITINNSGSGTAHNTVQKSLLVYWNLPK
jgi:hypothetical protein